MKTVKPVMLAVAAALALGSGPVRAQEVEAGSAVGQRGVADEQAGHGQEGWRSTSRARQW